MVPAFTFIFAFVPGLLVQGDSAELRRLRGPALVGQLESVTPDSVTLKPIQADGVQPAVITPLRECVSLQLRRMDARGASPDRQGGRSVRVEFANGDMLQGILAAGGGTDRITLQMSGASVQIPVDSARKIVFAEKMPPTVLELEANRNGDRLYRLQRVAGVEPQLEGLNGTLVSIGDKTVEFEGVLGRTAFPLDDVVAIILTPLSGGPRKDFISDVTVSLIPDGRLQARLVRADAQTLELETAAMGKFTVPSRVAFSLRFHTDQYQDLSALEPVEVEETPYFGGDGQLGSVRFPWVRNRNVMGGPMVVAGTYCESGLGVHSKSKLTFSPGGAYTAFRVRAGIDDSTLSLPRRGSVVFRILGDGKTLFESPIVRSGDRLLDIPEIAIRNMSKLTLEVDFADNYDIADRANWCEPILIRDAAAGTGGAASLPAGTASRPASGK